MIFKIQRAIVSSIESPPCLIYNEDRTKLFEADANDLMDGALKIYVDADIVGHEFCIKKIVEDQDW